MSALELRRTVPSVAFRRLLAELESPAQVPASLAEERAGFDSWMAQRPLRADVAITAANGYPGVSEWLRPVQPEPDAAVLAIHGGGFRVGSVITGRPIAATLAALGGLGVLNLDYPLAPEHPFPAAGEAAWAAFETMQREFDAERIVLAGDSAGAALALGVLIRARDEGLPPPAGAYLLSPAADLRPEPDPAAAVRDPMLDRRMLAAMRADYVGSADPADPAVSPARATFTGVAPVFVQFGGAELLAPGIRALVERLNAAGVAVRAEEWEGMFHVWPIFAGELPEADAALATAAAAIRAMLGLSPADASPDPADPGAGSAP